MEREEARETALGFVDLLDDLLRRGKPVKLSGDVRVDQKWGIALIDKLREAVRALVATG